jgi:2-C-methyl-D-erythritol 4-phosphate cytidylyltransferase/2-C-methyl-D-erythritol 2,4-cyclodiphosphate synthase
MWHHFSSFGLTVAPLRQRFGELSRDHRRGDPMAVFSVVIVTAPPPGQNAEGGGAFVKIDGREALLRSVELFLNRDNVKQVVVVVCSDDMEEAKRKYGGHFGFSGVKMITGGPHWIDQLAAAAEKISPEATHVIVHDGARPAVPYYDIENGMEAAEKNAVVGLVASPRAALVELDEGGQPVGYRRADSVAMLLTPLFYARQKFVDMAKTKQETHASELTLVKGSPLNIRVSGGDAGLLKAMLNMLPKPKVKPPSSPFEEAQW